jgi:hypothetical protein
LSLLLPHDETPPFQGGLLFNHSEKKQGMNHEQKDKESFDKCGDFHSRFSGWFSNLPCYGNTFGKDGIQTGNDR